MIFLRLRSKGSSFVFFAGELPRPVTVDVSSSASLLSVCKLTEVGGGARFPYCLVSLWAHHRKCRSQRLPWPSWDLMVSSYKTLRSDHSWLCVSYQCSRGLGHCRAWSATFVGQMLPLVTCTGYQKGLLLLADPRHLCYFCSLLIKAVTLLILITVHNNRQNDGKSLTFPPIVTETFDNVVHLIFE